MEIMKDPVFTSDGQTYERSAIVRWLSTSEKSPLTNNYLANTTLIPNHALRKRIQDWIQGYSQYMEGGGFDF